MIANLGENTLTVLAPFLSGETLDTLADTQIAKGEYEGFGRTISLLVGNALRKIAKQLMTQGDWDNLQQVSVFL